MPKLVNVSDDPTKWSRIEATLKQCRAVCTALTVDQLPSENWFRRRDEHKEREVKEFEPDSWYPLVHLIREMGGFRAIRACLSQTNLDRTKWTKEHTATEVQQFLDEHNALPGSVAARLYKKKDCTEAEKTLRKFAMNLFQAARRVGLAEDQ